MVEIAFEDIDEIPGVNSEFLFAWYSDVVKRRGKTLGEICVVFCSDEHLLQMNRDFLNHDYYTDIITFDYSETGSVSGDLFISIDRVADNAKDLKVLFDDELHRVCVHGVLHLCGLKDKTESDEKVMRIAEEEALSLRMFHVEHLKSK